MLTPAELQRFADRIVAIQNKDTALPDTKLDDGWTATGDGSSVGLRLFPCFRATNADHILTEHDNPSDWQSFARRSIDHLRSIGL